MQQMPIDVGRLGTCMCVVPPEPRVNPDTGEVRKDRDGNTVYVVGVSVRQRDRRRADVIEISVPVEPRGVAEGVPVQVADLVATAWAIGDRHGVSFRASGITPAGPPGGAAGTPGPARGKTAGGES
ncbi:hypothetical protein [Streptomyces lydicus]|uniref:SCO3933 family regulatory protein n=1 Tax=Streptomyces lydicus TaxID=47763 RepID=UPI00101118A5|nr:hypothetical protein [Streptomyces lydicus]MCZ1009433.1 hypothetical protein [Streptomyces lydicus]